MASSSHTATSEAPIWNYDVFLSFRGTDTRKGITSEIHDALKRRGIKTFMDDQDLQKGDVISPTLLAAIRESRFAIVVLSRDYASSTWCLDELLEICRCMEGNSQTKENEEHVDNIRTKMKRRMENRILPLFYDVDPTDVRHQTKSFGDAFTRHVNAGRHTEETVQQWRDALKLVATFSGWNTQDHRTHKELVHDIVEYVCNKVSRVSCITIIRASRAWIIWILCLSYLGMIFYWRGKISWDFWLNKNIGVQIHI